MKAHIDTVAKTIKIDDNIVMGELETELDKLFPKGDWRFYTLIVTLVPPAALNNPWIQSIPLGGGTTQIQSSPPTWTITQSIPDNFFDVKKDEPASWDSLPDHKTAIIHNDRV